MTRLRGFLAFIVVLAAVSGCHGSPVEPTPAPTAPLMVAGDGWVSVSPQLREGLLMEDPTQDWASCLVKYGDTTFVVCPDGRVYSS